MRRFLGVILTLEKLPGLSDFKSVDFGFFFDFNTWFMLKLINYFFFDEKQNSPTLNNITLIGAIFGYISIIVLGLDENQGLSKDTMSMMCNVHVWMLSVSFTLVFGPLFAKLKKNYSL